ncbi:aminopeptidase [Streptomyces sp. NPDC059447]|uniref:aminopeptidase n=1 Tax=Streptomyces sp. NPDC059447 TaxID=3346834 RepID=UPI003692154F
METVRDRMDEELRVLRLLEAERLAQAVFARVVTDGVIAAGRYGTEVDRDIRAIASSVAGPLLAGPGRLVRSGPHAVIPSAYGTVDRLIGEDDVVTVDLSPLLAAHETGFARTVVLGEDLRRHQLVDELTGLLTYAREVFRHSTNITGRLLYAEVRDLADEGGWRLGSWHVGRIAGTAMTQAPEVLADADLIAFENSRPLRRTDRAGFAAHWVMEIHLVDERLGYGGTLKQLLDLA